MKYIIAIFITLTITFTSTAQLRIPAVSPSTTIVQRIGLTDITLNYFRPNQNDRELFGNSGLVRNNELWRTGANGATSLEISTDITINGTKLPKGKYAILSTPSSDHWTIHLYNYTSGSWTTYRDLTPAYNITATSSLSPSSMTSLNLFFDDITMDSGNLNLWWGNKLVSMDITVPVHDKVMTNIERTLSGPSNNDYFQAALYLHETNTDLPQALSYIQTVTQKDKALFFQVYREALILKDLGKNEEALIAAKRSKSLSEKAKNNDFVRLNEKLIKSLM